MQTATPRNMRTALLQVAALLLVVFIFVQYGKQTVQRGSGFFRSDRGNELEQSQIDGSARVKPSDDRYR